MRGNTGVYSSSSSDLTTTTQLVIGCYNVQSGQFFAGEIDEVRVWRIARDEGQIRNYMCKKFDTAPQALVAYYRFDQTGTAAVADDGTMPVAGTLVNLSSNNWHLSGAPLGDVSASLYQSTWPAGTRLPLATLSGDSAIVSTISASTRGVQLYVVNGAPSIAPPGAAVTDYVGVFTVGNTPAASTYALRPRPRTGPACRNVFVRPSNELAWTLPTPLPTTTTSLLITSALYRGEHLLTPDIAVPVAIAGDSVLCGGARTQLSVVTAGAATYRWNTGATYGTGCTVTDRREVRLNSAVAPPAFTLGADTTLCDGDQLLLQGPVGAGLRYQWSDGSDSRQLLVQAAGRYTLRVLTTCGEQSATRSVTTRSCVSVPNVVTANADRKNDSFAVQGLHQG